MTLKEQYKQKIDELSSKSFNQDQKDLAKKIIDAAPEKEVQDWFQLIIQKVKLGFTFDSAPEVFQGAISLVHENKELGINLDKEGVNEHKLIIGENYDALKNLLLVYRNKVNVIYIDPPYNTEKTKEDGNHLGVDADIKAKAFIYRDKFSRTGWLNMMNERLKLAKQLLSDDGVIFVSIDDNEQAYLKVLMDEVFGEQNFVGNIARKTKTNSTNEDIFAKNADYVLIYTNGKTGSIIGQSYATNDDQYIFSDEHSKTRGNFLIKHPIDKKDYQAILDFKIVINGKTFVPGGDENEFLRRQNGNTKPDDYRWTWGRETIEWGIENDLLSIKNNRIYKKQYQNVSIDASKRIIIPKTENLRFLSTLELIDNSITNEVGTKELEKIFGARIFNFPKPASLLKKILNFMGSDIIILDFFAGSGTTGQAVMELNEEDGGNRQFILVTNNENNIATNVTRERLLRVITGKGSNNETFEWKYSKEKPYLGNNKVKIYETKTRKVDFGQDVNKLIETAKQELKNLDSSYEQDSEIDIVHDLNSLHPLEEE